MSNNQIPIYEDRPLSLKRARIASSRDTTVHRAPIPTPSDINSPHILPTLRNHSIRRHGFHSVSQTPHIVLPSNTPNDYQTNK